jgi:hypothetical protein
MLPPVLSTLKRHFKEAELQGLAISRGRRVKPLSEINSGERDKLAGCGENRPAPTTVGVRMLDGKPMTFYNDGSIRHAFGKPSREARKASKGLMRDIKNGVRP